MKCRKYSEMKELKNLIRRKNMSYRRLAGAIGISTDAINNKLNGYTAFNLYEAEKIINILDISAEDINRYFFGNHCETQQKSGRDYIFLYWGRLYLKKGRVIYWRMKRKRDTNLMEYGISEYAYREMIYYYK